MDDSDREKKEYQRERKYVIYTACTGVLLILKISFYFSTYTTFFSIKKTDFCHLAYLCVSCDKDYLKRLPPRNTINRLHWSVLCEARRESLNTICFNFAMDYFYYTRLGLYVSLKCFNTLNSYHMSCFAVMICQISSNNERPVKLIGEQLPTLCNVQNNLLFITCSL